MPHNCGEDSDGHKTQNNQVGKNRRAEKFSYSKLKGGEPGDALEIKSVQLFFAVNGKQLVDSAADQQYEDLHLQNELEHLDCVRGDRLAVGSRLEGIPNRQRDGGADYGGGDGAAGAQLDAGVAQEFGIGPG